MSSLRGSTADSNTSVRNNDSAGDNSESESNSVDGDFYHFLFAASCAVSLTIVLGYFIHFCRVILQVL